MNPDDHIHRRLRELRNDDARRAPSFERVLHREVQPASRRMPRLAWASVAAICAVAVTFLWRASHEPLPELSPAAIEALEAAVEPVPSDALLASSDFAETSALTHEINSLLNDNTPQL